MLDAAPLVSVIISTMNARTHLQTCLDSVYAQTMPHWEIIIIDGGSQDGTLDVIRKNEARLRFWMSEPDRGVYDAWNKGLQHVTADWVIFLGADDGFCSAETLATIAPLLQENIGRTPVVYGKVAFTDEDGRLLREEGKAWCYIADRFTREMCIPHQGVFHHRSLFSDGRGFDSSFRYAGDYDLLLGAVALSSPVFADQLIAYWRQGGLTSDPGQSIRVLREFRRARAKRGSGGRHPYWSEFKAWSKYLLPRLLGERIAHRIVRLYREKPSW